MERIETIDSSIEDPQELSPFDVLDMAISCRVSEEYFASPDVYDDVLQKVDEDNVLFVALRNTLSSYSRKLLIPTLSSLLSTSLGSVSGQGTPDKPSDLQDKENISPNNDAKTNIQRKGTGRHSLSSLKNSGSLIEPQPTLHESTGLSRDVDISETLHVEEAYKVYLITGEPGSDHTLVIGKTWNPSKNQEDLCPELDLYRHEKYLRPLQGNIVPWVTNIRHHRAEEGVCAEFRLPTAIFWIQACRDMSKILKRKIIDAYDAIHKRGILHNNVDPRNMLINDMGEVILINFQKSKLLSPEDGLNISIASEMEIALEKRLVRFILDFEGSRKEEIQQRERTMKSRRSKIRNCRTRKTRRRNSAQIRDDTNATLSNANEENELADSNYPIPSVSEWKNKWEIPDHKPQCYVTTKHELLLRYAIMSFIACELERKRIHGEQSLSTPNVLEMIKFDIDFENPVPSLTAETSTSATGALDVVPSVINDAAANAVQNTQPSSSLKHQRDEEARNVDDESFLRAKRQKIDLDELDEFDDNSDDEVRIKNDKQGNWEEVMPVKVLSKIISAYRTIEQSKDSVYQFIEQYKKEERGPELIHVPYEGYTGPDKVIIPNVFLTEEVYRLRRHWIRENNVKICEKEGLPHPENRETPRGINSKVRNRGPLKRYKRQVRNPGESLREADFQIQEYFRKRQRNQGPEIHEGCDEENEGTDTNTEPDGIPEGPQIMTWEDFNNEEIISHTYVGDQTEPFCPRHRGTSEPLESILKRKLTPTDVSRAKRYIQFAKPVKAMEYISAKSREFGFSLAEFDQHWRKYNEETRAMLPSKRPCEETEDEENQSKRQRLNPDTLTKAIPNTETNSFMAPREGDKVFKSDRSQKSDFGFQKYANVPNISTTQASVREGGISICPRCTVSTPASTNHKKSPVQKPISPSFKDSDVKRTSTSSTSLEPHKVTGSLPELHEASFSGVNQPPRPTGLQDYVCEPSTCAWASPVIRPAQPKEKRKGISEWLFSVLGTK